MEVQTCIQLNITILQAIHGHLFQPQWKLVEGNTFKEVAQDPAPFFVFENSRYFQRAIFFF